jgi:hypothetical protein
MTSFSTINYMREGVTAVALMFALIYDDAVEKMRIFRQEAIYF